MHGLRWDQLVAIEGQESTRRGMNCYKTQLNAKLSPPKRSDCVRRKGAVERRSEITVKKLARLELDFSRKALGLFHSESRFRPEPPTHVEFPESFARRGRRDFIAFWNTAVFSKNSQILENALRNNVGRGNAMVAAACRVRQRSSSANAVEDGSRPAVRGVASRRVAGDNWGNSTYPIPARSCS